VTVRVQDNLGTDWIVMKGDMAERTLRRLKSVGFTSVVLPVEVLMGKGKGEYETLETIKALSGGQQEIALRMNDCLMALED
jgi:hypothetical protein